MVLITGAKSNIEYLAYLLITKHEEALINHYYGALPFCNGDINLLLDALTIDVQNYLDEDELEFTGDLKDLTEFIYFNLI